VLRIAAVTVLAHQGGWDETLMVLTPIAVFALLLKLANGRASRAQAAAAGAGDPVPGPSDEQANHEQANHEQANPDRANDPVDDPATGVDGRGPVSPA
jgi:hypothetical protein